MCGTRCGGWAAPIAIALVAAFGRIPALYIADGHHRAASAARARAEMRDRRLAGTSLGDGADASTFLAVAFPNDQVQILAYNRIVKDLGGLTPEAFLTAVDARFEVAPGPAAPARAGDIAMYFGGAWRTLVPRARPDPSDAIGSLDVSVLQDQLLAPVLKIADVRTDKRIDFVGGARGTAALEALVASGKAAVAFSLYPGQRGRPDGRVRRGRDHAAEEHVVRAEAPGRPADSRHLSSPQERERRDGVGVGPARASRSGSRLLTTARER